MKKWDIELWQPWSFGFHQEPARHERLGAPQARVAMSKPWALRSRSVLRSVAVAWAGSLTRNAIPRFSTIVIRSDARLLNSCVAISEPGSPARR